jgi:hypothetical protein
MSEKVVEHPELARLVELARAQPVPPIFATAASIEATRKRGDARLLRNVAATTIASLAAAVALWLGSGLGTDPGGGRAMQGSVGVHDFSGTSVHVDVDAPLLPRSRLPESVVVEVLAGADAFVADSRSVVLTEGGAYRIGVPASERFTLRIRAEGFGERVLELDDGHLEVDLRGEEAVVRLLAGHAAFVSPDGTRELITTSKRSSNHAERESASTLARAAEAAMADGDATTAIELLERLLAEHGSSAQARSAVLDLARLHRARGDTNAARCAYEFYLRKWPHGSVRPEVERALGKLGPGVCERP